MSKKKISTNEFIDTKEQQEKLLKLLKETENMDGKLLTILQKAQEIYGFLPYEVMKRIANYVDEPIEKLYGIATFYTQFRLSPQGKYQINICLGTACYIKGSGEVLEELKKDLGIDSGECTKDGKFSLDTTRCLGCCGLAPALMINGTVYGNVKVGDVKKILDSCE